jgi:hypothetical protein
MMINSYIYDYSIQNDTCTNIISNFNIYVIRDNFVSLQCNDLSICFFNFSSVLSYNSLNYACPVIGVEYLCRECKLLT